MNTTPKISVIVPVYNTEMYLHRCIDSILSQTFTDFELLLIDDGSKDSSGTICDEYAAKDSRVRVFHKENGGVSSARNLGLDNAKGDWITFVDADDYMFPDMLVTMLSVLELKKSDIVICGTTETGGGFWKPKADKDYSIEDLKNDFVSLLHTELLSPPWCKIYSRDKIGDIRFNDDVSFGEDLMFNIQYLATCENISFIEYSPFYHEKGNDVSLVVKFNRNRLLDIEKVWVVVDDFSADKSGLYKKYLRDIVVYTRQLFKSELNFSEQKVILEQWHKVAKIKAVKLCQYKVDYINTVLLLLLKHKLWRMANILVNWKKIIGIK